MDTSTSKNITRHRLKARTRQRSMTRPPFKNDSVKNSYWDKVGIEPDIQGLFNEFNSEYFYGKLPQVNLKWTYRISTAAGLCWPDGNGNYIVRLNKPLLEQRPRRNTAEILLHEMIHVYQFVTCARDLDHGASFQYHCRRIKKLTGVKITTYHQFHKEYDELKRHWWICQGPCGELVRRTMNRPPCTKAHKRKCGGDFVKIQEPNESPAKKKRKI